MWLVLLLGIAAACGRNDEYVVGAACAANADCAERCERGEDFPRGTCTVECRSDRDCPQGTSCIDREGGMCLVSCIDPFDCREGYTCKARRNRGHRGDSLVCLGR